MNQVLKEVRNRGFRESNENLPNSYQLKENLLLITISDFTDFQGIKKTSRKVALDFNKKRIISLDNGLNSFVLPPYPLISKNKNGISNKSYIPLSKIPLTLKTLVIKNEDKNFHTHFGIDIPAILRAFYVNFKALKYKQGASTITQQVAKNLFLTREKTINRKLKELIYTFLLEYKLNKSEILAIYLNEIYLGQKGQHAIYGVEKGAKAYFNKDLNELNPVEIASIVALIKEPGILSKNRELLNKKAIKILKKHNVKFSPNHKFRIKNTKPNFNRSYSRYFYQSLSNEIKKKSKVKDLNYLKIFTGINEEMQKCANETIVNRLKKFPKLDASLVSLNPNNGIIKSWVGGKNFVKSQFDRVNQSKRQIGSLIKPFIYLKNFEDNRKLSPQSTVLDIPITVKLKNGKSWNPNNYDNKFLGPISLRKALEKSRNMPAILTLKDIGIKKFTEYISSLTLTDISFYNPSIALGTIEASLLDIVGAYTIFANNGLYVKPRLYKSFFNKDELIINGEKKIKFASDTSTFLINSILTGVISNGTARSLIDFEVSTNLAGKTGTTNSGKDFWFIGYTPKLITGVWVGRDDNRKTTLTSADLLFPIVGQYLNCIGKNNYDFNFVQPKGIKKIKIDQKSQSLAHKHCPKKSVIDEFYRKSNFPNMSCSLH